MSNQQFTNQFYGYSSHNGNQDQNMMADDQAMAAAMAANAGQVPLQIPGQMSGQMSQMSHMPPLDQMQQMNHMTQMNSMAQMQQMPQMPQMPLPGQGAVSQSTQDADADIMAYLDNPSFFDSFAQIPGMLDSNPAETSGTANSGLAPPTGAPGSMFPPSIPPSFTAAPTNPGSNTTADDGPDKDSDMLDVGTGDSGPGGDNEPGGGPQPVDEFIQASNSSAVTAAGAAGAAAANPTASLTEFTRRKDWTAKLVEEMRDVLIIIDSNQRIKFASPSIASTLGYSTKAAVGLSLDKLVHRDDQAVFLADLNSSIATGTQLRLYMRIRKGNYKPKKVDPESGRASCDDGGAGDNGEYVNGATNGETNDEDMEGSESTTGPESYCIVEVVGHAHVASPRYARSTANMSPFCQAVFLVARPYPTKNASLLDSFLEHKMENERLRRRIDDLRREEESEDRDDESHTQSQSQAYTQAHSQGNSIWRPSIDGRSDLGTSDNGLAGSVSGATGVPATIFRAGISGNSMPPPSTGGLNMGPAGIPGGLPASLAGGIPQRVVDMSSEEFNNMIAQNPALTRENLEGSSAHKSDSLLDKMMRYNDGKTDAPDGNSTAAGIAGSSSTVTAGGKRTGAGVGAGGPSAANTISLLTGLYYAEGERSKGLSTGNRSPRLIKGDAGIAISANRVDRGGMSGSAGAVVASDKKKKLRVADEYVCNDCGTLDSPEWRKGPGGPKTLCNACGLRWAKKEKKEKKKAAAMAMPGSLAGAPPGSMGSSGAGPVSNNGPAGMV